jgi:hypothetical protein
MQRQVARRLLFSIRLAGAAVSSGVDASIGPLIVHGAVEPLTGTRNAGVALPPTRIWSVRV